jgi:lysophospholipase L1-like esterase
MINSGVGGDSDRGKMVRYENDVLAHDPDILLLQFGGNNCRFDLPDETVPVQEMEAYLEEIGNTVPDKTRLVFITFPPVLWHKHKFYMDDPEAFTAFYAKYGGPDACRNRYHQAVKAFAAKHACPVVDLYDAMKGRADLESLQIGDGVHLNAAGDRFLAELVFQALISLLQRT